MEPAAWILLPGVWILLPQQWHLRRDQREMATAVVRWMLWKQPAPVPLVDPPGAGWLGVGCH